MAARPAVAAEGEVERGRASAAAAASAASSSARRAATSSPTRAAVRADRLAGRGRSSGARDLIASLTSDSGDARPEERRARPRRARRASPAAAIAAGASSRWPSRQRGVVDGHRSRPSRAAAPASKQRTVVAIATLSDSAAPGHGDGDRSRRARRELRRSARGPRSRRRPRSGARGRRRSSGCHAPGQRRRGSRPLPSASSASTAATVSHVHHRDPEDRAGRRPHHLGVAHVDRSGTRTIPPAPAASALRRSVPRLPGSATSSATMSRGRRAASTLGPAPSDRRRDREDRLGRARRADLLEHALLERRRRARPAASSRRDERRERRARAGPRYTRRAARRGRARPRPRAALRPRTPPPRRARVARAVAQHA